MYIYTTYPYIKFHIKYLPLYEYIRSGPLRGETSLGGEEENKNILQKRARTVDGSGNIRIGHTLLEI